MVLELTEIENIFKSSRDSNIGLGKSGFTKIRYESGNTTPDISEGEIVIWELGQGQGEFFTNDTSEVDLDATIERKGTSFTIGTTSEDGDFTLATIAIKVFREGSPGTIDMELWEVDGDGFPTGSTISTGSFDGNTLGTSSPGEVVTITMTTVTLKAGTKYAWSLKGDSLSASNEIKIRRNLTPGSYPAGNGLESNDSGSSWADVNGSRYFDLQGGGKFMLIKMTDGVVYQATLTKLP